MVDPLTLGFKLYARNEFFRYQKTGQREFTIIIHQTVYRQRRPINLSSNPVIHKWNEMKRIKK